MIPVHVKYPNGQPPSSTHYVVAGNGIFLHKKEWWINAVLPVRQITVLDDEMPSVEILLPKLDASILVKALKLAYEIYLSLDSEVCLLLHYNKDQGYEVSVPQQVVGPAFLEYDPSERLPGYRCVGTIHSHAAMPAFHSSIDHADEVGSDGVHITLGDIGSYPSFSISAEGSVNGNRFLIPETWFEGFRKRGRNRIFSYGDMEDWQVPKEWLEKVHPFMQPFNKKQLKKKGGE